ncbi:MAG: hypothetical protein AAFQ40_09775 [Cyanobacteria bacterium J06623_5]
MTSSAIPQHSDSHQPESQPASRVRKKRERSQPTLWAVASIFFLMGAAASTLTIWQLYKLYRATVAPPVDVSGIVQAQYDYDTVAGLNPPPSGYYIEGTSIGRVYLTGKPLQSYVGEAITANGSVSGICGPKSIPCYPLVELREVSLLVEEASE